MSDRILFNENFGDLEWTGNISKKAILPTSALTIPNPVLSYDNYYYVLDGVIYNCTSITKTSRYLTFLYTEDGTNTLYVRLEKQNNYVTITILPAYFPDVNFETSVLTLYEKEQPLPAGEYKGLVRFNKWRAVEVVYHEGSFTYNLITDGNIPNTEIKHIKHGLIRFTNTLAVRIIYNEIEDTVEIVEV